MVANKPSKKDPRAWDSLDPPLPEWILDFVSSSGFPRMTPVQTATLANFLGKSNKDVVVEAVTGSGKTLAFLIPVIQRLLQTEHWPRHHLGAIIIAPTRELAVQIHSVLLSILAFHPHSAELLPHLQSDERRPDASGPAVVPQLLIGGTTTPAEDLAFFMRHSPNIVVSTPGRLVELLSSPRVHCPQSHFEVLIMDEADRLLDLGFKPDLQKILAYLPKQRRTGLFSASVSEAVGELIRVGLRNPVRVAVRVKSLKDGVVIEDRKTPASLQMCHIITPASKKLLVLSQLLARLPKQPQKSIVFMSSCAAVDYFQHILPALLPSEFTLVPLHGKHQPKVRAKNFARFTTSVSPTVLLTTDLAARGLDIPQVDLVVQIDVPSDPKVFIHRCGRAGRAGRKGLAVVLLQPGVEQDYIPFMEIRKTPITPLTEPEIDVSDAEATAATAKIRNLVLSDRGLYDKAQKGFVSWVRSYAAHQATSIFNVRNQDWADVSNGWGLLRLPKMPESKGWKGDTRLGLALDWDAYAYADKTRERARQEALTADGAGAESEKAGDARAHKRKQNEAWSHKVDQEGVREERREKRRKRKDAKTLAHMTDEDKVSKMELDELILEVRRRNGAGQPGQEAAAPATTMAKTSSSSAVKKKKVATTDEFSGFDD